MTPKLNVFNTVIFFLYTAIKLKLTHNIDHASIILILTKVGGKNEQCNTNKKKDLP